MTRVLFVDGSTVSSTQDGSLNNPYRKIQTAVDVVNASVAEIMAEFPIGSLVTVPPTPGEFPIGEGEVVTPPTVGGRGGVRHFPIPPTVADSVQDWMILVAPGDYDEDLAISGPVRLALIGLGAFRLGRYTSLGVTQSGQTNIVAEDRGTRNLVWTYTQAQSIQNGGAPQVVIGTIGGTDVYRHGKPIVNRISGSIIVQGVGWTSGNVPRGGTAFLGIANTQVDAGITANQPDPTQPAIDTTGSPFTASPRSPRIPFDPFTGSLVDRHFSCRFRGEILGSLSSGPETPPTYVLVSSFMSQYEKRVQVSRYGSIQQATFSEGMTVSQNPTLPSVFRFGVPPGIVNSNFYGTFEFRAPAPSGDGALLLDPITNFWFNRNGATLVGGATRSLLFDTSI